VIYAVRNDHKLVHCELALDMLWLHHHCILTNGCGPGTHCSLFCLSTNLISTDLLVARSLTLRKFNLLAPVPPPSYHNTFTIVMNPQTPDTPASPISTNAKKTTAADADPTLKLQRGNEGGTNNNAGSVSVS